MKEYASDPTRRRAVRARVSHSASDNRKECEDPHELFAIKKSVLRELIGRGQMQKLKKSVGVDDKHTVKHGQFLMFRELGTASDATVFAPTKKEKKSKKAQNGAEDEPDDEVEEAKPFALTLPHHSLRDLEYLSVTPSSLSYRTVTPPYDADSSSSLPPETESKTLNRSPNHFPTFDRALNSSAKIETPTPLRDAVTLEYIVRNPGATLSLPYPFLYSDITFFSLLPLEFSILIRGSNLRQGS